MTFHRNTIDSYIRFDDDLQLWQQVYLTQPSQQDQ